MVKELNQLIREARAGNEKPYFIHIPNDGSGAQKVEFEHRPVDVTYPPEMDGEKVKLYTNAFINQLPRNIRPVILMLGWMEYKHTQKPKYGLSVILDKLPHPEALTLDLEEMKDRLSLDVMEAFQKFGWKLVESAGVFNEKVTVEEATMTLVYREVEPTVFGSWMATAY